MKDLGAARSAVAPHSEIWDVLVEECRVYDRLDDFHGFQTHWPECREYRFIGALGFGGKIWSTGRDDRPWYVNCYREHENPARIAMMKRANERLAAIYEKFSAERATARNPESPND